MEDISPKYNDGDLSIVQNSVEYTFMFYILRFNFCSIRRDKGLFTCTKSKC